MITTIALGLLGGLTLTVARFIRAGLLRLDPAAPQHRIRLDVHGRDW